MRNTVLLLVTLLGIAVSAGEEKIRGTLEKTDKPGACAQITDALGDVYYLTQTADAEKLVAEFVGKNTKVVVTGAIEAKDGKNFINLKSVETYVAKMPPAPPPSATPAPAVGDSPEEKNKAAGEAFLAENKKKEGVTTTASGLQYKILKNAEGDKPGPTSTVKVHYRGTTLDGNEFDSSYKRNAPATFPLNGVIKGWTEGLQLMPAGAKFQFFIPSDLAYGKRGKGPTIGPNETLIFEVELLSIEK